MPIQKLCASLSVLSKIDRDNFARFIRNWEVKLEEAMLACLRCVEKAMDGKGLQGCACEEATVDALLKLLPQVVPLLELQRTQLYQGLNAMSGEKQDLFRDFMQLWGPPQELELLDLMLKQVVQARGLTPSELYQKWLPTMGFDRSRLDAGLDKIVQFMEEFEGIQKLRSIKLSRWLQAMDASEGEGFLEFVGSSPKRKQLRHLVSLFIETVIETPLIAKNSSQEDDEESESRRGLGRKDLFMVWKKSSSYTEKDANMLSAGIMRVTKLLDQFVALKELKSNPIGGAMQVVHAVHRRGWSSSMADTLKDAEKVLDKTPIDADAYFHRYHLESYKLIQLLQATGRYDEDSYKAAIAAADVSFAVNKLRLICSAISQSQVIGKEEPYLGVLPHYLLETGVNPDWPLLIQIYVCIYRLYSDDDGKPYLDLLKQLLADRKERISAETVRDAYLYAINYCIRKLNAPGKSYHQTIWDLAEIYLRVFRTGELVVNGEVGIVEVRNMVVFAMKYGKIKLGRLALGKAEPYLSRKADPYAVLHLQTILKYSEGASNLVVADFRRVIAGTKDPLLKVDANVYLSRALYELEMYDAILDDFARVWVYLRRWKPAPDETRARFQMFHSCLKELAVLQNKFLDHQAMLTGPKLKEACEALATRVQALRTMVDTQNTVAHRWLLEAIDKAEIKFKIWFRPRQKVP